MLRDIGMYALALVWGWLGVTGGVLATALAIYERAIKKENLHVKRYAFILAVFFVVAGFTAWRDELNKSRLRDQENESLKNQIDNLTKTDFHLKIIGLATGRLDAGGSQAILVLKVTNKGASASLAADTWSLRVTTPSGTYNGRGRMIAPGDGESICFEGKGQAIKIVSADALERNASHNIERNGIVEGVLIFELPDLTSEQLGNSATVFSVAVQDVTGRDISTVDSAASVGEKLTAFTSGLTYPYLVPSEKCRGK